MTTNHTPAPEGPAQEPEACLCVCPRCMPRDQERTSGGLHCGEGKCSRAPVPATPTPSQPAGAREWLVAQHRANPGHVNWRLMLRHEDVVVELLEAYARQQTAAKDAELKACWNQLCDIGFMFDVVTPENNLRLAEIVKHKKEAAVRERDSLREANARLAADLDAALKAGKDGQ